MRKATAFQGGVRWEAKLKADTVRYWEKKPLHLKRSAPKYYQAMNWCKRYGAGREFAVVGIRLDIEDVECNANCMYRR